MIFIFIGLKGTGPKFKVGDCIQNYNRFEFKELYKPHNRRIVRVGKYTNLYTFHDGELKGEFSILITDEYYHKVDTSICEKEGF